MTVYIVTNGEYSEYRIEQVFSTKEAAEEYRKWHNIYNEVEEYHVHEEAFPDKSLQKVMFIDVHGLVYPEAVVNLTYNKHPDTIDNEVRRSYTSIHSSHMKNVFGMTTYMYIPADQWDEEACMERITKVLYDKAALAKALFAEGASITDVQSVLNKED